MSVEITGFINKNGMVIDFFDLNKIVKPILEKYDHAFLCWEGDSKVKNFLVKNRMKKVIVNYHSTVENICNDFTEKLSAKLTKIKNHKFEELTVKIYESPNSFAEKSRILNRDLVI